MLKTSHLFYEAVPRMLFFLFHLSNTNHWKPRSCSWPSLPGQAWRRFHWEPPRSGWRWLSPWSRRRKRRWSCAGHPRCPSPTARQRSRRRGSWRSRVALRPNRQKLTLLKDKPLFHPIKQLHAAAMKRTDFLLSYESARVSDNRSKSCLNFWNLPRK